MNYPLNHIVCGNPIIEIFKGSYLLNQKEFEEMKKEPEKYLTHESDFFREIAKLIIENNK